VSVGNGGGVQETGKKVLPLHVPNPLTTLTIAQDHRHVLVTGSSYSAFDFVHSSKPSTASSRPPVLERLARGTVKAWRGTLGSQSDAELAVTCSRTARQLTSSMTSQGFGVTCVATPCGGDSGLLAVGLSTVAPCTTMTSSSVTSSGAAVVVVICARESLETLCLVDDLTVSSTCINDMVAFVDRTQPKNDATSVSLFVSTDTTLHRLQLTTSAGL